MRKVSFLFVLFVALTGLVGLSFADTTTWSGESTVDLTMFRILNLEPPVWLTASASACDDPYYPRPCNDDGPECFSDSDCSKLTSCETGIGMPKCHATYNFCYCIDPWSE